MNESTKRRGWIKNIIIIFLVVILLLTLFSNTILNYSLPEVAVQYPQYAAIASRVRATATVEANQNYGVTIEQTRVIASVEVRKGAKINKGDVLFRLEEGDSAELDEATRTLQNLKIQLLEKMKADPSLNPSTSGSTVDSLKKQLNNLKSELEVARQELTRREKALSEVISLKEKVPNAVEKAQAENRKTQLDLNIEYLDEEIARLTGKQNQLGGDGFYTPAEIEELIRGASEAAEAAENSYIWFGMQYDEANAKVKTLEEQIKTAQTKYDNAEKAVTEYQGGMSGGGNTSNTVYQKYQALQTAQQNLSNAQQYFTEAEYTEARQNYLAAKSAYDQAFAAKDPDLANKKAAMEAAKAIYTPLETEYQKIQSLKQTVATATQEYWRAQQDMSVSSQENSILTSLKNARDTAKSELDNLNAAKKTADETAADRKEKFDEATAERDEAKKELEKAEGYRQYDSLGEEIKKLKVQLAEAKTELEEVQEILDSTSPNNRDAVEQQLIEKQQSVNDQKKIIAGIEEDVIEAQQNISKAELQEELNKQGADLDQQKYNIELEQLKKQIENQEAAVKRLEENQIDGKVISPVSGVVESLNVSAGQKAEANSPIAYITLSDMGYTMKTTVTAEQAAKIRVGDEATLQWYYHGTAPSARVVSIKSDTASSGQNKTVTLDVTGDVTPGTSLTFTLGNKNTTYDCVVPNSAVREDANGKFVLIVVAKSTPLGNRYTARRVEVEVLESDETNSAVSGAISGEYVITTSAQPITDGTAVRLAED